MPLGASWRFQPNDGGNLTSDAVNSLDPGLNVYRQGAGSLNVNVTAGRFVCSLGQVSYAGATGVAIPPSSTDRALWLTTGAVLTQGAAFPATEHFPLALVDSSGSEVTAVDDQRPRAGAAVEREHEAFFPAAYGASLGDRPVLTVATAGTGRFGFHVPAQARAIVRVSLVGIPAAGAAGAAKDIDLFSEYAALTEARTQHTASETAATYDLTGTTDEPTEFNLTALFASLAAGDYAGVRVLHNTIGGDIHYLGIVLRYRT